MNSTVKKRSIVIDRRKTSISLEDIFWTSLKQIAQERVTTVPELIRTLDASRNGGNLSSTIRMFVLDYYRPPLVQPWPPHIAEPAPSCQNSREVNGWAKFP